MIDETNKPTSIKQLFQSMIPESIALTEGLVTKENPVTVQVVNNPKMIVTGKNLVVSWHLTDYKTKMSFDNPSIQQPISVDDNIEVNKIIINGGAPQDAKLYKNGKDGITGKLRNVKKVKHEITVYNALKEGEKVWLLRFESGKQYYVVDRVVVT